MYFKLPSIMFLVRKLYTNHNYKICINIIIIISNWLVSIIAHTTYIEYNFVYNNL